MKTTNSILSLILMLCMSSATVFAEEPYWETIKQLMIEYNNAEGIETNEKAAQKYTEYIESLTTKQLLEAGRQCAGQMNEKYLEHGFAEGVGFSIAFFLHRYPIIGGLEDPNVLFVDIKDTKHSPMWRSTLMHGIAQPKWIKHLSKDQLGMFVDAIDSVFDEEDSHYMIIFESIGATRAIIGEIEKRTAIDIDAPGASGKADDIIAYYNRFSERILDIFNEPSSHPVLQRQSLGMISFLLDKPLRTKTGMENAIVNATGNFQHYNEDVWLRLLRIGMDNQLLTNPAELAMSMKTELESRHNTEMNEERKIQIYLQLTELCRFGSRNDWGPSRNFWAVPRRVTR